MLSLSRALAPVFDFADRNDNWLLNDETVSHRAQKGVEHPKNALSYGPYIMMNVGNIGLAP